VKTKYQTLLIAAIGAALVLVVGGLLLGLTGMALFAPKAEARTETAPALQASDSSRTITVVGEGKASASPDLAQANIGVEVIGPEVKQTSADASQTMESLLAAIKAQGVAENDIETSYFNVWVERPFNPQGSPSDDVLYHVNNNVMVTIRDLDNVPTVLGAAIEAGANTINSVNFNLADPEQLKSEAREKAVANALAKARELAGLNGLEVGEVVNVTEVISGGPLYGGAAYSVEAAAIGGGGPLLPGEVDVTVQIQVTYALK
jgi:uncharacterized protein YggE